MDTANVPKLHCDGMAVLPVIADLVVQALPLEWEFGDIP
jgi:hypothetical protein